MQFALADALTNISTRRARAASLMPCKTDKRGNPYITLNGSTRAFVIPAFVVFVLGFVSTSMYTEGSPRTTIVLLVMCLVGIVVTSRFLLLKLTLTESGLVYRGFAKKEFTYCKLREMTRDHSMAYLTKPNIDNRDELKTMTRDDLIAYFAKPAKDSQDVEGFLYIANCIILFFTLFHGSHDFAELMESKIGTTIEQVEQLDKIPPGAMRKTLISSLIVFTILVAGLIVIFI